MRALPHRVVRGWRRTGGRDRQAAPAENHHPDVDLRYEGVTVCLGTHSIGGLSERDVTLARQISEAARELEVPADPTAAQVDNVAIDALVGPEVQPFWRAVLGYRENGPEYLVDPHGGPSFWFQPIDAPRPQRNRIHVDVSVPHDQGRGARRGGDRRRRPPGDRPVRAAWWVLSDAEGNEACVATWMGRD